MAYDKSKDEILWEARVDISNPFSKASIKFMFLVRVMKYDGGQKKIDIKRLKYGRGSGGEFVNLGRIAFHEMEQLLPIINEAMGKVERRVT